MIAVQGKTESPTRPVLRYHGGKWDLGPWIISHFPRHTVYCEPFGGAASVLLQKPRAYKEIYNDLNYEVVSLFRVLRDRRNTQDLICSLILTPYAKAEYALSYSEASDIIEQARRLIVRSHFSFSNRSTTSKQETGFKTRARSLNSSAGDEWQNFITSIALVVERLSGVVIECRDAFSLMKQHDTVETLFYLDPPYPEESRNYYGTYTHEFDESKHRVLSTIAHACKGMVALSGYRCPLYDELYGGWHQVKRETRGDNQALRTEVLWLNEACYSALENERQQKSEKVLPLFHSELNEMEKLSRS